jgi:hypothetical protein
MIFTINKNTHKSFRFPRLTFERKIVGQFNFLSGYDYEIDNQKDTNKLIGISDDIHHHSNSIRIGWRYFNEKIEISAIVYSNKKRTITKITEVLPNTFYNFSIKIQKENYVININHDIEFIIERKSKYRFIRYILFPYFGGKTKAPNKIQINLKYKLKNI